MVKTASAGQKTKDLIGAIRDIPDFPKPGILFKDITPLLGEPRLFKKAIELLAQPYLNLSLDYAVGIESRGFLLASALAYRLGCGVVPVRKKGKLPYKTFNAAYDLEYGKDALEIHQDAFTRGRRIVIVDDVLATGGTSLATAELVKQAGGQVVGISFLIELLPLGGRQKIAAYPVHSLIQF